MRIAIVHETLDPRRGGAETSVLEMAAELRARGLDVTLVTPGDPDPDDPPGLHRIPVRGDKLLRAIRFVADADRYTRDTGFEIVHAVSPCFSANVYQPRGGTYAETIDRTLARVGNPLLRAVKRLGRRFNRRQRFLRLTEQQLLADRRPPFVAAVSQYVARQIPKTAPAFPPDRIRVVFNGVRVAACSAADLDQRRARIRAELETPPSRRVLLFAAHNFALKGLPQLLAAIGRLRTDDWELWLAGRGRLPGGLDRRVRPLGPRGDMHDLFAAADVLAHPTWYDPCSRVVLEALALGLPVVTTRYNGAAEIMQAGIHGAVIDTPGDIAALAAALDQALSPEVADACRAAREATRQRVSMARHAEELEALYREVITAT